MYDELIKRLRYAASYDERIVIQDAKDAAYAIEELQLENEKLHNDLGKALRKIAKYRWIPVTERLPEKNGDYLVVFESWAWDGNLTNIGITAFCNNDFNRDRWQKITHWMPLPEPPKADKSGDS